MILVSYFLKRYFKYFFIINSAFTLLFNFIEFFEKIVRLKNSSTGTILHFIGLNILPSFFENFALSSWITTCLLLKEFNQQNEIETFQILNINSKHLFKLFFIAGIITSIISFCGKEFLVLNLLNKSEQFKFEKLKQASKNKIFNKWLTISQTDQKNSPDIFCYFSYLDLEKNEGKDLLLIYLDSKFKIEKSITCNNFSINFKEKRILAPTSVMFDINQNINIPNKSFDQIFPTFFSQLELNSKIPSLKLLAINLISFRNILPDNIYKELLQQFLKRILSHSLVIIYPLLTFCLFFIIPNPPVIKWILIMLPYPLITFLTAWLTILSYFLLILAIIICKKRLEKTF